MKEKILVTGGTGYIGSHTVVELIQNGTEVLVVDNLSNSSAEVIENIEKICGKRPKFDCIDLVDRESLLEYFRQNPGINLVIHFAAFKSVGESVSNPLKYYRNNLISLMNLLEAMNIYGVPNIVFSSSCTVYGQPDTLPVTEDSPVKLAFSPYGNTKQICEEIIKDYTLVNPIQCVSLRYFNPIGAHESALIGELPNGTPNNLLPLVTQTAIGKREFLSVFGSDYNTPDGTAIRDYIHVVDVAKAHIAAVEYMAFQKNKSSFEVFNLGNGQGYSVLEVIHSFEKVSGVKLNYRLTGRRSGDVEKVYADTSLANRILGWKAIKDLDEMTLSAWNWEKAIKK